MEKDLLVVEYAELCLKWVSFAGPAPVDQKEQMQIACRIDEIRHLLDMKPIYLADKLHRKRAENLYTLEPQIWIPVSERLPGIRESVLITLWDRTVTVGQWYGHRWGHAKAYQEDVLAWMPLPDSYGPQNSERR